MRDEVEARRPVYITEADDETLAIAARHDRRQFVLLYDRYVERIERYILARTRSTSEVDDLVSATFMHALRKIHTYQQHRGTFAAWLFTIARNIVRDHERRRRRFSDAEPAEALDTAAGPEVLALKSETAAGVRAALRSLTPDQSEALALRYASELSFADIGRAMGKSEAAAKMLVQRGLRALRHQFEENESP